MNETLPVATPRAVAVALLFLLSIATSETALAQGGAATPGETSGTPLAPLRPGVVGWAARRDRGEAASHVRFFPAVISFPVQHGREEPP